MSTCDALSLGRAAFRLGAGRARAEDAVHPGVGLRVLRKVGDMVAAGEPLVVLVHDDLGLAEAIEMASSAYTIAG